jgi:hypothetical protein
MRSTVGLRTDLENWWRHQDRLMSVAESMDDIEIGGVKFKPWGDKHLYNMKTKNTFTYLRTFQSTEVFENLNGEQIYPILDVYIDICHGRKAITYKKHRVYCSC